MATELSIFCQTSKFIRNQKISDSDLAVIVINSDGTRKASHPRGFSRERRPAECDERRDARLHQRREHLKECWATESPQHREERLVKQRKRDRVARAVKSTNLHQRRQQLCSESRESRLQQMRVVVECSV